MSRFPDPRYTRNDVIAIGGDLRVETLRDAYRHGIFPWPHPEIPLPWFSPRWRAVLFFEEIHIGRTLRKAINNASYEYSIDRDFRAVISACSRAPRPGQDGTWIDEDIIEAYTALHQVGDAHSIEAWEDGTLVGGLYGVDCGGAFTGESMFYLRPNASRLALLFIMDYLRERGLSWLDCQVMTPHMEALGAREIRRGEFLDLLAEAQARGIRLF